MKYNLYPEETLGFSYNFERDGGAIGTIGMGVFVPANSILTLGGFVITQDLGPVPGTSHLEFGIVGDTALLTNIEVDAQFPGIRAFPNDLYFFPWVFDDTEIIATITDQDIDAGEVIGELRFRRYQL